MTAAMIVSVIAVAASLVLALRALPRRNLPGATVLWMAGAWIAIIGAVFAAFAWLG